MRFWALVAQIYDKPTDKFSNAHMQLQVEMEPNGLSKSFQRQIKHRIVAIATPSIANGHKWKHYAMNI